MIIQFHPVIENRKEAVREVHDNQWCLDGEVIKRFHNWNFGVSPSKYPIYRRIDLDVDPIKEVWDKYQLHNVIENVGPYIGARKFFLAIQDYIKKVYGNEFSKVV